MKAGWRVVPLGDLCRIELGSTPSRGSAAMWDEKRETSNVWLSIADLPQTLHSVAVDSKEYVSDRAAAGMRIVPKGTLLVSFKLTLGRLAYAGRDLFTNEAIASLLDLDKSKIDQRFLYWALTHFDWDKAAEGDQKIKGKTLNKAKLKVLPIPLPPLDEQKQIVAVLDEVFEGLSRARSNAEANLADARELFEYGINSLMSSDPAAVETGLGALCSFENGDRGKNYPGRKAFVSFGVPFINAGHLLNGPIDWAAMNYIPSESFHRLSNGKVKRGDLLFCLRGSLGKFGIVDSDELGAIASSLVIVRPDKDRLLPGYLAAYFKSKRCKDMISEFENGAAQPNLSAKNLAAFKIALPSALHQEKVVERVSELEDHVESLIKFYSDQKTKLEAVHKSLLQRAFCGDLVR